jgi:hypothetical protein
MVHSLTLLKISFLLLVFKSFLFALTQVLLPHRNEELPSLDKIYLGVGISLFTTTSRQAPSSTQPPIQLVPGAISLQVKRPGREADHSPPPSAEVKNAWSYTSIPTVRLQCVAFSYKAHRQICLLPLLVLKFSFSFIPMFPSPYES